MNGDTTQLFWIFSIVTILVALTAFYYLLVGRNLIRILIAIELLFKGVTLLLAVAGYVSGRMPLAQAFIITLVVIEVMVIAVGAGIVIGSYRHTGNLDVAGLRKLKG